MHSFKDDWSLIVYNCTVRENRITTLGLSLSGTIAIKQCACNRFLLTIESTMWQRKKNTASPWVEPVIQQCAGQYTHYQTLGHSL